MVVVVEEEDEEVDLQTVETKTQTNSIHWLPPPVVPYKKVVTLCPNQRISFFLLLVSSLHFPRRATVILV